MEPPNYRLLKIPRFFAHVEWVVDREAPAGAELINPVWFPEDGPTADGWSLVLSLSAPVVRGDKESMGVVHLMMPWAPHHHLRPGRALEFREGKKLIARLLLGEPAGFLEVEAGTDNETWIIETGHRVIEKKARQGIDQLTEWERLVYCVWVADYMMRNAGDFAIADDLYPAFQREGLELATTLALPRIREAFDLSREQFQAEYFARFKAICEELKQAQPTAA